MKNKFETFKKITIGGLDKSELLKRCLETGVQFNAYAKTLFEHPLFAPPAETEVVKLVKTSLRELGLDERCSFEEFSARAFSHGLRLGPLYLAAFLRLEYLDQPEGPHLTIASAPPEPDENYPKGFYIRRNDGVLWLRGYQADGFEGWPEGNEFIFLS